MVAGWLGPLSPPHSWSPSSGMDSGSLLRPTSDHKKISSPAMSILRIFHKMSTALLLTFFLSENVASFRLSFGVLLPVIADHFKVGRAEAALISSFMTLLTLGSGRHICAMKSFSFHPF